MDEVRYLYSEVVPRSNLAPSLLSIPPRLVHAAERYASLAEIFNGMTRQVEKAPEVKVRLADLEEANPPLMVDIEGVLPWSKFTDLRLLVSEILHHLRAAADHLVYNVAWLDSGSEQKRTQFPVYGTKKDFDSNTPRMLAGVNATHRAWIEAVQPFHGVAWAESLAYLSNNDKHNYLLEVVPTLSYRIDLHSAKSLSEEPDMAALSVDDLSTHLRLIRRDGKPYFPVDEQVGAILSGFTVLLNQFLREAGISEVRYGFQPGGS